MAKKLVEGFFHLRDFDLDEVCNWSLDTLFEQGLECVLAYHVQFNKSVIQSMKLIEFVTKGAKKYDNINVVVSKEEIAPSCLVTVQYHSNKYFAAVATLDERYDASRINGVGATVELSIADLANKLQSVVLITNRTDIINGVSREFIQVEFIETPVEYDSMAQ